VSSSAPTKQAPEGLAGLLGSLDAALADAELLAGLGEAVDRGTPSAQSELLQLLVQSQVWRQAHWWRLVDGALVAEARSSGSGELPWPRTGVGPLGRSLALGRNSILRPSTELDCPRCRLADRAGDSWVAVLLGASGPVEGRLELTGCPPGGVGPERVALLGHVAWMLARTSRQQAEP
jgi:hypothetical protein